MRNKGFKIPRLLGDVNNKDTQFTAMLKKYQQWLFLAGCGVFILLVFLLTLTFTARPEGTWRIGLCKVFLERYAQYPTVLDILVAGESQSSAQIGYITTNAYGSQESELMECFYNIGAQGITLNRVTIDRIPLDQEIIDAFNPTIMSIIGQEDMDKTMPPPLPAKLEDLKRE